MAARFRIRTPRGQELSFASLEMFSEFVRSGELSPEDFVYDAETGEWSPARTHPLVLELEYEAEEAAGEAAENGHADEARSGGDFGLELAPEPEGMTPEEQSAAFVAEMEAERAAEFEEPGAGGVQGLTRESTSGLADMVGQADEPAAEPERPAFQPSGRQRPSLAPKAEAEAVPVAAAPPRRKARKRHRAFPTGKVVAAVLVVGIGVGAYLLVPGLLDSGGGDAATDGAAAGGGDAGSPGGAQAGTPTGGAGGTPSTGGGGRAVRQPTIADTEEALAERAQSLFVTSTRSMLRSLPVIPEDWLGGAYLAEPTAYTGMRQVWEQYLETIQEVRSGESERYRTAYLQALDDAGVEGSARTLRLASATTDFAAASSGREAHYLRVETLASAALRLHDELAAIEGSISYEPASGPTVSADPVLEAAGVDEDSQAILDEVLDDVLDALYAEGLGPEEAANVPAWVLEGFEDSFER